MSYTILPGVKQDHKGRLFQLASYPNGKLIEVPYHSNGAAPARMIPLPKEPEPKQKPLVTTGVGEKRTLLSLRKRRHVLFYRYNGEDRVNKLSFTDEPGENIQRDRHATALHDIRWVGADYFFAYHEWVGEEQQK